MSSDPGTRAGCAAPAPAELLLGPIAIALAPPETAPVPATPSPLPITTLKALSTPPPW
jgi:hypothetical protein